MRYSEKTLFKQLGIVAVVMVLVGGAGGFATTPSYGQAQTTTSTLRVPFSETLINCGVGPVVQVSGDALFVFHTTINPDGTSSLQVTHFGAEGLRGTAVSGEPVIVSDGSTSIISDRISNNVFHSTGHLTILVNGLPNSVFILVANTLINEDGTTKHDTVHINQRCVGQG